LTVQAQVATNRAQFYYDFPQDRSMAITGRVRNPLRVYLEWWRQGMMGGAKAHYDGIVPSPRRTSPRPKEINVPVLVMHGDDTRCAVRHRHRRRQSC